MGLLAVVLSKRPVAWTSVGAGSGFLTGLTPYLWILFRAERVFPSWGASDPFGFWLTNGWEWWATRWTDDWDLTRSFGAWGLATAWLLALALLRMILASRRRPVSLIGMDPLLLIASFATGWAGFSDETGLLAPTAILVPYALARSWCNPETASSSRREPLEAGRWDWKFLVPAMAILLSLLPGQRVERQNQDLPRRHALNFLLHAGPKTALIFEDPHEASGCLLLQETEGVARDTLILERRSLVERGYLAGLIRHRPDWLFSNGNGSADSILQDMVASNLDRWDIRWAVSELPARWEGILSTASWTSHPQVLTQRLVPSGPNEPTFEDPSLRLDLSGWLPAPEDPDASDRLHRARYTRGFMDVGNRMARLGRYTLAIRSFERAAKLDPGYKAPREALNRLYTESRVLEAARMEFVKILKEHPPRIRFWMQKAGEYGQEGTDPRILEALDQVIRLNVELSDAQLHLGLIYQKEGRAREGQDLIESAARLAPQQVEVQMELGRQRLRAGNRVKAEEAFRAVLGIDPENKEAQKQLWRLLNRP